MKNRLGLTFLATGTLLLAAVSGCADNDADPAPTRPSNSSPTESMEPTGTASPTSPNDAATADATAAMTDYYAVLDGLRADRASDLKKLETVAIGAQLNAVQTLVERQRDQGQRQTGTTAISELKVQSVTLDNSDPDAGKVPTVVIDVCWDVSKVDVLDKSGKSIVSPNRPDTGWTRYTVANYDYAADPSGGWRVATGQDLRQTPCAAS
jgi:hypothetical protein